MEFFQKLLFKLNSKIFINKLYTLYLKNFRGLETESIIPFNTKFTWPHQVKIGKNCTLEDYISFKFDGPYQKGSAIIIGDNVHIGSGCEFNINLGIEIKSNTMIASGVKFIDHDHGIDKSSLMCYQIGLKAKIFIEEDVWIGANAVILKGSNIKNGAIVAAGCVVTKSIPAFEIWGGVPGKKVKTRI